MKPGLAQWVVAVPMILVLGSCGPGDRPPGPAFEEEPEFRRFSGPRDLAVIERDGDWACVRKDEQGEVLSIVVGLVRGTGERRTPGLPKTFFAEPMLVPLSSQLTIQVPMGQLRGLFAVTFEGTSGLAPPAPLAELADALWNAERDHRSIRDIVGSRERHAHR